MLGNDIEKLLQPYIVSGNPIPAAVYDQLALYLQLLLKWNARTNLTAIREPEEIVRRHFGESLFAAQHIGACETLLDFGSGAGFPGLPIQLFRPDIHVTLAESQNKKSTFLREVIRTLNLQSEVWATRVEAMPAEVQFDIVTLRAVDNMEAALAEASVRARKQILLLTTAKAPPAESDHFEMSSSVRMPGTSDQQLVFMGRKGHH